MRYLKLAACLAVACGSQPDPAFPVTGPRARDDGSWHSVRLGFSPTSKLFRDLAVGYEIVMPAHVSADVQLVVLPAHPLHGLRMRGFLEHLQRLTEDRIAVMIVHAANVAYARSSQRYREHMAEPEFQRDANDIVLAAIDDALQRFPTLANTGVTCLGWSGSANACWMLAINAPTRIAAIDVVSSGFNPTTPGADFDKLRCTAVRIEHGGQDHIIGRERPLAAAERLRSIGGDVTLVIHEASGHSDQSDAVLSDALEWLARQHLRSAADCVARR